MFCIITVLPVRGGATEQSALAHAQGETISMTRRRGILELGILDLQLDLPFRIERGQVVEIHPVTRDIQIVEIDLG